MADPSAEKAPVIMTIGHSTRPLDEFIETLKSHCVDLVADVRTVPRSRHNPQFNRESLPEELARAGIGYDHIPRLGGLRHFQLENSPNMGWRNKSFRAYADYMQTPEFLESLARLMDRARQQRIALMCAEVLPWRCHRSLIADSLVLCGFTVEHIIGEHNCQLHKLTPWARVENGHITYPPAADAA